jgi:hypothetical protein
MKMKIRYAIMGGLMAASLAQAETPITLVNQGFELPGTVKTEYWNTNGAIVPGVIPGWEPSGVGVEVGGPVAGPGDSGVESDTSIGLWRGYLAGRDPSIYQTTTHNIQAGETFFLAVAAKDVYTEFLGGAQAPNSAVINLSLYYLNGANRISLENQNITLSGFAFTNYTIDVLSIPGLAVGKPIGIEIDNVSDVYDVGGDVVRSWVGLDNVRLSFVPEPATTVLLSIGAASLLIFRRRRA